VNNCPRCNASVSDTLTGIYHGCPYCPATVRELHSRAVSDERQATDQDVRDAVSQAEV
jgi:predicted  nucleic acid-binding Zn-ribbon protein